VRHVLGIDAFGVNAYRGESEGDLVVEEHEGQHQELSSSPSRMYVYQREMVFLRDRLSIERIERLSDVDASSATEQHPARATTSRWVPVTRMGCGPHAADVRTSRLRISDPPLLRSGSMRARSHSATPQDASRATGRDRLGRLRRDMRQHPAHAARSRPKR
jgi:hypothetical protein